MVDEPCFDRGRRRFWLLGLARLRVRRRRRAEGFGDEVVRAFFDFDSVVCGQILKNLGQPAWPANCGAHRSLESAYSKEELLGVLGQKSGASLKIFRLAVRASFHGQGGADGVAIALRSAEAKSH